MKRIHRGFLCFVLLLSSLSSFAQERYPIRVYQIGSKVFTADSAGATVFTYSVANASVDAIGPLIQLTTDKRVRSYTPAKFLNSSGAPWGATVSDAVSAFQASTAISSGGGGSGGSFSGNAADITSGTLNVARLPASVLLSTGSYSNPAWLTALDPAKVTQTSLFRFTTDTEKSTWNNKQNALTLTTTGSGAATFNQTTGALNIPTASGGSTDTTIIATKAYVNPKFAAKQNNLTVTTTGSGAATFNQATGALNIPTASGSGSTDSTVYATRAYVNPKFSAVSSLTATYQPETIAFAQAHRLAGSSVDARQLTAVDRVIVGIKNAGFFTKIKDFMPFLGSNLSASLIKLVGTATATQTGFSETDYSQAGLDSSPLGVVNSTRYVDMGVDATTLGLAYNNIGLFVGLSDGGFGVRNSTAATGSSGAVIANYDAAVTDSRAFLLLNGASSIAGTSIGGPISYVQGMSSGSGGVTAFRNGIQHATAVAGSNTLAVTGNFNLFRGKIGGNTFFLSERIGVSVITSSLTDAEGKTLSLLLLQYLRETGRILSNPFLVGFGDSITAGAGAQNPSAGGWVARLANKLGYTNLNTGIGSTTFRLSTAGFPGGYDRYTELYALPMNLMTIMYGTNDIGGDGNANGTSSTISDLFGKYQTMLTNLKRRVPRIIMVSPPYRNDANDTKMTAYVSSQANLAVAQGFPFVDAYNIFLDTGSPATYFPTGLHPNDLGAQVIADHVFAALQGRLYRDALLDFPSIAAGASATLTVTMYTARAGQALSVTLPESVRSLGIQLSGYWISANDTVTIQLTNPTGAAIDPPSANYKTVVWLN